MLCRAFIRQWIFAAVAVCSACNSIDKEVSGIEFSCEPGGAIRFKNRAIELELDSLMYCRVYHLKDGERLSLTLADPLSGKSVPSHFIVIGDKEVKDFRVDYKALECPQVVGGFGPGRRLILKGVSGALSGARIEKTLTIELYEHHPDAAITRAAYRNLSPGPLRLGDIYSSAFVLSASQADPALAPNRLHAFYGNAGRLVPQIDSELPDGRWK